MGAQQQERCRRRVRRPGPRLAVVPLAASLVLLLPGVATSADPVPGGRPTAPALGGSSTYCQLDDPMINESSGLAVSTRDPSRLWTHNDSGDTARIFALGAPRKDRCPTLGVVRLAGVDAFDAEDLAAGPGHTLWLADIGDNIGQRSRIVLDRVVEPETISGEVEVPAARFRFSYPDEPHDAEAVLVAPSGQVVVVTKGSTSKPRIYAAPGRPATPGTSAPPAAVPLIGHGELNAPGAGGTFSAITGGAVSPDGRLVVLRTYLGAYLYPVVGDDLVGALLAAPRSVSLPPQPQGESVAFTTDGRALLVSSEGVDSPVLRIPLVSGDGDGGVVGSLVGTKGSRRPLVITVVVAAVVLGLALAFFRRRRR
ncbi:MAG: hypothetical protein QOC80_1962 [Frankiaceae bacterium]|nr:hypothetical protein [Frankiaceae bacterium]